MKFYKDILNALQIETAYIISNDILYSCLLLEFSGMNFFVSSDASELKGNIKFKIKYRGSFIYFDAVIMKKVKDTIYSFTYEIGIAEEERNKDAFKQHFFSELKNIENLNEGWNKRKEVRYEIGLDEDKGKLINFKSIEQVLIADKLQLPCVVNNLSYSGAKVTTVGGNFFKDKTVCLNLSFRNPIEQIPLVSSIKNCLIKSTSEKEIVSILSIKYDYSPLTYKQRIDSYIKALTERGIK